MTTKKKTATPKVVSKKTGKPADEEKAPKPSVTPKSAEFEEALRDYALGLELLHKGEHEQALHHFGGIQRLSAEEPVLAERAKTYAAICARKLAGPGRAPQTADECYHLGVVKANEGALDEAAGLFDRAVELEPTNASYLYARASVRGLQGNPHAAAADLKKAIALEPRLRHQVGNDDDFASVRDEAVFIDVIEPTPAGA
jgi:tetratricopeptide (TPR) repeat protein